MSTKLEVITNTPTSTANSFVINQFFWLAQHTITKVTFNGENVISVFLKRSLSDEKTRVGSVMSGTFAIQR